MKGYQWIIKVVAVAVVVAAAVTVVFIYKEQILDWLQQGKTKISSLKNKYKEEELFSDFEDM